jgi:hypothetical protein
MDYTYEVDLANGKTFKITYGEKRSPFFGIAVIGGSSSSSGDEPIGSYSAAELIELLQQSPTFTDITGNTHASSAILSVRKTAEFIDLPMIISK